ncbi:MAG: hypothetical protein JO337_05530 [Acidimicrobiales bacterium]|nr:hypothetical protein [Acidimicrobiales bacterium]
MRRAQMAGAIGGGLLVAGTAFGIGFAQTNGAGHPSSQHVGVTTPSDASTTVPARISSPTTVGATTIPCSLAGGSGPGQSVPVNEVCSSEGAPHFGSPESAMTYLAAAWNSRDVREIDYVTDPAGRQQMDSMAAEMVNLKFKSCAENPAGDYTCYFSHNITPSTSATTYPNPGGYPPGVAVFTVAPAAGPGWYLTNVVHCG